MRHLRTSLATLAVTGLLAVPGAVAGPFAAGAATGATGPSNSQTSTGTVRILVVDDRSESHATGGGLRTTAVADVGGRLLDVPPAQAAQLEAGDIVAVTSAKGATTASAVRVIPPDDVTSENSGSPYGRTAASAVTAAASAIGTHTLTVLPVYWNSPDPVAPLATLTALASATATYWSQQSGGRMAFTPTVRDWVRIGDPGSCSQSALANAALAAHGVSLPTSTNDHVMVYFPRRSDCGGWAGLGQVGGSMTWINGYPLIDVAAHEIGHNLGLGHANTATCTSGSTRVTLSSSCTVAEYRDYADVMGIAMDAPSGTLNTALADVLGLAQTVTASTGARTSVDLAPLTRTDAVRALKIRVSSGWVYADYRPAVAPDVRMPNWAGVQLHYLPDTVGSGTPASQLLDARPSTSPFSTVSLPAGASVALPGSGLTLSVTSVGTSSARVETAPDTVVTAIAAPTVTAPAGNTLTGPVVPISWQSTAKVATLRLFVDGRQVAAPTVNAASGTVKLSGLSDGRHALTLQSVGTNGTVSPVSSSVSITVDALPPTTPTGLALSTKQVLSWTASTDATSGVAAYLVSLDGGAATRVTTTSWTANTPVGRHTWWVAAVDKVGNASPASGLVVSRASASAKATAVQTVSASARSGQRTLVTGRTVGASHPL